MTGADYWQAYELQLQQQYLAAGSPLHHDEDKMPKISEMIESKYLKQSDVDGEIPVTVKGVKVDPMQHPLPAGAQYVNAYIRDGRLIVVDLEVDEKVVVRRK